MKFSGHKEYRKAEDNLKDEDKKLTKYFKINEFEMKNNQMINI